MDIFHISTSVMGISCYRPVSSYIQGCIYVLAGTFYYCIACIAQKDFGISHILFTYLFKYLIKWQHLDILSYITFLYGCGFFSLSAFWSKSNSLISIPNIRVIRLITPAMKAYQTTYEVAAFSQVAQSRNRGKQLAWLRLQANKT